MFLSCQVRVFARSKIEAELFRDSGYDIVSYILTMAGSSLRHPREGDSRRV